MTIRIHKPLQWRDQAIVETWPKDIRGLLYLRDFTVKNQADELCATCTSGWLAIDIQSKRPRKVEDKFGYLFNRLRDRHAMEELPEKLDPLEEGERSERQVTWFDLDVNRHVTSTRYIDWMVDTLPADFLTSHYPILLSINYLKETMMGESVTLLRSTMAPDHFLIEGADKKSGTARFRGRLVF
jgi:acyl-ACP thioesterase